ncbi:MAG: glycosyltransferase [Butyrivibrio sp.]|jgi:glycosyltransferase involved in cell wall biosynthesis|nr:glycosyltransferase [Butyrivibrio sp.]
MSDAQPRLSIIIPAYNTETLLRKCVESVLEQTYPQDHMEIIIVDDGSADSTGLVADALEAENDNVICFHESNAGSSAARNLGLSHATGDYIGFVDSDDYIDPHMYEVLVDALVRNHARMAQVCRDEIAEDGKKLPDVVIPPQQEQTVSAEEFLCSLLMHTGDTSYCTKLTARELFSQKMQFPTGMLNEDFYLLFHMLPEAGSVVILPQQYYHVFYRTGSNSRKKQQDKDCFPPVFTDIVNNADAVTAFVSAKYPALVPVAVRFGLVQRLDYLLHIPISRMTGDNRFYRQVVHYVRVHFREILVNPYLSRRDRIYLLLLAPAPKLVRTLHARKKGLL